MDAPVVSDDRLFDFRGLGLFDVLPFLPRMDSARRSYTNFVLMNAVHPATRLVLMQVFVILGGIASTAVMLKVWGYPDPEPTIRWNPTAIFLRNWGLLLLAIPAIWSVCAIRWEQNSDFWTTRWTVLSGYLLLAALTAFLGFTAIRAGYYRI